MWRLIGGGLLLWSTSALAASTYVKESDTVMLEQTPVTEERRYTLAELNAKRADYVEAIAEIDALLAEAATLGVKEPVVEEIPTP